MTSRALARALARAGLEPGGPLGAGAGGPRWAARDSAGRGWAVTVVPADALVRDELRRRVAALAGLEHQHVARVAPLLELRDGTAAVLQAEVPGPDLQTVAGARGAWRPGEVATIVVPLAEALAALHAIGIAHGDVAPGNVVLGPDGRPVLVDLVLGAAATEAGTPGLAAPERRGGATAAADVHALARLGLALLGAGEGGGEGGGDGGAQHGTNGGADDAAPLVAVLSAAAATDPAARPSAARLAADVYAACPPEPVRTPDAAVLARLALRRLAVPPDDSTIRLVTPSAGRPRGRHRQPRSRRGVVAVVAAGLALAGVVAGAGHGRPAEPGAPGSVGSPAAAVVRGAGSTDPVTAAIRLTRDRAAALAEGDSPALAAVTVPGSPAAAADAVVAGEAWRRTPTGGGVEVSEARLLDVAPGTPTVARVAVTARAWVRTGEPADRTGSAEPSPEPSPESVTVVLVLNRTADGWRVSAVEPPPGR